jgi:hypothetical protein
VKASIDSMICRALTICSTYTSLAAEFNEIRRIGQANDYPISFIDTHIGIGLSRHLAKNNETASPQVIGCEKKLTHLSSKIRSDLDVCFCTKPPPAVQTYFQNKDPIVKHMQSNIVYSVNCIDCGQTYIGKTERQAIRRMKEHGAPSTTYEQPTAIPRPSPKRQKEPTGSLLLDDLFS